MLLSKSAVKGRPGFVLALLCVASLCNLTWVRTAEQVLVPGLMFGDQVLRGWLPERAEESQFTAEVAAVSAPGASAVEQAWGAWLAAVSLRPPVADVGREPTVVAVLSHDARRQELLLRVPDVELERDSPVTHRGVLVGFLRPWSERDERVVMDGQARVALLGHPRARPVAATWDDDPMRFLVTSRKEVPTVVLRSRRIRPRPGQLAVSRPVGALGDTLPGGLMLGRVAPVETDLPGGSVALHPQDEPSLEALLDPDVLALVAIEVPANVDQRRRVLQGQLLSSSLSSTSWFLDQGQVDGVNAGDEVVQGHRWVGRISWAGPFTAVVSRVLPRTSLLVGDGEQALVPVGLTPGAWPVDWRPREGLPVFCGQPGWGGLYVGHLGTVDHEVLTIDQGDFDTALPVTVLLR
ncbi:MAG: hypothetical protein ACI9EF_002047 [Pseudohongiellaceae bacterium]|jgi:hypothetical protein